MPQPDVFLRYFPSALVLNRRPQRDEFLNRLSDYEASWFTGKFIGYGEPSLAERVSDRKFEAYRVLQISVRGLSDFAIRVETGMAGPRIESKWPARCENGREDGIVTASQRGVLGDAAWFELAACMDRAFWSAPLRDGMMNEDSLTTVFEGVRRGQHHVIVRSDLLDEEGVPERPALALCQALFEAAAGWTRRSPSGE